MSTSNTSPLRDESQLSKRLMELASIMDDCGLLKSTSGDAQRVMREAATALREAEVRSLRSQDKPVAWQERHQKSPAESWSDWYDAASSNAMGKGPRLSEVLNGVEYQWRPVYTEASQPTVIPRHGFVNHPDDEAAERFCARMKWKLAQARDKGKSGWRDPEWTPEMISQASCKFAAWWPHNRNKFTTTRQAALAGWHACRAALRSEPGLCGCKLGECESKANAVCRMSEEIKNGDAQ